MADARRALERVGLSVTLKGAAGPPAAAGARSRRPPGWSDRPGRAVEAYLAAVRDGGRSPETVALYRAALGRFVRWLDGERPGATCADLSHDLVDAYVRHLRRERPRGRATPLADRSVHLYVVVLKLFARWGARGRRYWPASPLGDYGTPGFTETDIVPYTREELAALLAACGPETTFMGRRLRAMLLVALDTGLRRGELRRLTVPTVDLDTGRVRLPAALTKTRRPRTVHLQRAALAALRSWLVARAALPGVRADDGPLFCGLAGAGLSDEAMHELAVRLRARSGVARFRWHLLRHTAGTESLRNGADSLDVQETLGHATPMMTRRYLHLTDDDRRARHARFSPVEALFGATGGAPEPRGRRLRRGAAPA
jgi:integrase